MRFEEKRKREREKRGNGFRERKKRERKVLNLRGTDKCAKYALIKHFQTWFVS